MIVIPAQAGTQEYIGCRIKSGMTSFDIFSCRSNKTKESLYGLLIPIYLRGYFEL